MVKLCLTVRRKKYLKMLKIKVTRSWCSAGYELAYELQNGIEISDDVRTVDECFDEIIRIWEKQKMIKAENVNYIYQHRSALNVKHLRDDEYWKWRTVPALLHLIGRPQAAENQRLRSALQRTCQKPTSGVLLLTVLTLPPESRFHRLCRKHSPDFVFHHHPETSAFEESCI